RDLIVTGVQTCALPISSGGFSSRSGSAAAQGAQTRASGGRASARESRASAQGTAGQNQAARQEARAGAQASRQQAYEDEHWDEGKGLAIAATGAVVGRAAGAMASASGCADRPGAPGAGAGSPRASPCPRLGQPVDRLAARAEA